MTNKILTIDDIKNTSLDSIIEKYRQGYNLSKLQIEIPVNVCQRAGQSGWAACDELGGMCENTNCPGECSAVPLADCGCVVTCSGVLPSQIPSQQPSSSVSPTPLTTAPPTSIPPSDQCNPDQFNIPLLGCQNKYTTIMGTSLGIVIIYMLTKR